MQTQSDGHVENVLFTVLLQLVVIIVASRLFGALFRRLGQPQVCGEIAAGLILGPSLFGGLFPGLFAKVFDPSVAPVLSVISQLGLVLLMFLIGLEFDFGHIEENRHIALSVSLVGILLPFGLGFLLGQKMHSALALGGSWIHFALFTAAAMSITAIPVLGRIMIELNINRTRIGSLTISAAAIDDAAGWVILAFATAVVRSSFDPVRMTLMIVEVLAFGLLMTFAIRPVLIRAIRWWMARAKGDLSLDALAVLLVVVFLAALCTNLIGIFSVFGAFLLGAILSDQHQFVEAVRRRLNDFVIVFFLPVFFTYTGLRTDIGSVTGWVMWFSCAMVLLVAMAGKFGGCTLAARWNGLPWRESAIVGVMMNTRGLMELIVINLGYDLGIISKPVFFMLVFMAVFTTYMTAPLLRILIRHSEMESAFRRSELGGQLEWEPELRH